ncbi:hypothetical protein IFM89_039220 [Coptis chinensis]|uniref:Cation efflux protein transmembrane domain-containing protein n=1 Tax=Coptis chinensis TaxID=261450 RepID=A0A835HZJ4_9MAGN|nr:hypothetical protein IFM89_039220 [Coptis chinensis]
MFSISENGQPLPRLVLRVGAKQMAELVEWLNDIVPNLSLLVEACIEEVRSCLLDGFVFCSILSRLNPTRVEEVVTTCLMLYSSNRIALNPKFAIDIRDSRFDRESLFLPRLWRHWEDDFHLTKEQEAWVISIMLSVTLVKLLLVLYCRFFTNEIVKAYAQDHFFDVITNIIGLVAVLVANYVNDFMDPVGAILL